MANHYTRQVYNHAERESRHMVATFVIEPTSNLPNKDHFFVSCDLIDMQPYRANCIIAADYFEALGMIARAARREGLKRYRVITKIESRRYAPRREYGDYA